MKTIFVNIEGMHCSHCEEILRNTLLSIKNVKEVEFIKHIAKITYVGELGHNELIRKVIKEGYITKEDYISENINDVKTDVDLREFLVILFIIIIIGILLIRIFNFNIFNFIPTIDNNITFGMLFLTGMFTSIHCISMCGSINLVATVNKEKNIKRGILYNLGRLISYTLIGGIVGGIGSVITFNENISGIIIIISSLFMFILSLNMLGFVHIKKIKLFKSRKKFVNPLVIGIMNGFMPCGPMQAMQIYALSTGSFILGAKSMFIFCLGTIPLMFLSSVIFNLFNGRKKIILNKIATVLIFILSIGMLFRGLTYFNVDIYHVFNNNVEYQEAIVQDNVQVIEFDLTYDSYKDIILHKGIPVKLIINVDKKYLTGCNNEIKINDFNINKKLEVGENIIEFTPDKKGEFIYSCWMNMIINKIKVID